MYEKEMVAPAGPRSVNKLVALTPFENKGVEKTTRNGFTTAKNKGSLTALTVVFNSGSFYYGTTVYVRSSLAFEQVGAEEFELDGKKFILVPEDRILLVK